VNREHKKKYTALSSTVGLLLNVVRLVTLKELQSVTKLICFFVKLWKSDSSLLEP